MSTRLIELESRFIMVALVGFAGVAFAATGAFGWLFGDGNAQLLLLPGVALLLGVTWLVVRTKRAIQVEQVRERLAAKPLGRYRIRVQMDASGQVIEFRSRVPLNLGDAVQVQADGHIGPFSGGRMLGLVVAMEYDL